MLRKSATSLLILALLFSLLTGCASGKITDNEKEENDEKLGHVVPNVPETNSQTNEEKEPTEDDTNEDLSEEASDSADSENESEEAGNNTSSSQDEESATDSQEQTSESTLPATDTFNTIFGNEMTLIEGESFQLKCTTVTDCTWTTSNAAVATVTADGVVTAVSPGSAVITASWDGGHADCKVMVHDGGTSSNDETISFDELINSAN